MQMMAALRFFEIANYAEAVFWAVVAVCFALAAFRQTGKIRRECWIAAGTFLLFGLSDVVEVQSGAWYRPWWLLLWKALCVLSITRLLTVYIRLRRGQNG
jgi:hypothetical protein